MYIPAVVAVFAIILAAALLFMDKNKDFNQKTTMFLSGFGLDNPASDRILLALKGFLLILTLVAILGAALFYF